MTHLTDIRSLHEKKRLLLGWTQTRKALARGLIARVYLASNASADTKADAAHLAPLAGASLIELEWPNEEIGATCRKPFPVSVIGVLKE